jgi:hypothetical protein
MDRPESSLDWSNEESLRYLSAINCLHNYSVGKSNANELLDNDGRHSRNDRPSKKIYLRFAETLEEILYFDADAASSTQCMRSINEKKKQEAPIVATGKSDELQVVESFPNSTVTSTSSLD